MTTEINKRLKTKGKKYGYFKTKLHPHPNHRPVVHLRYFACPIVEGGGDYLHLLRHREGVIIGDELHNLFE